MQYGNNIVMQYEYMYISCIPHILIQDWMRFKIVQVDENRHYTHSYRPYSQLIDVAESTCKRSELFD